MPGLLGWFRRAKPPEEPRTLSISADQYDAIMDVCAVFETGKVLDRKPYDTVTIHADGAGITYGCHQFTRQLLCDVLSEYYKRGGGLVIDAAPLLLHEAHAIVNRSVRLFSLPASGEARALTDALARAGHEPIMQEAQRHVARSGIWDPTLAVCRALGLRYALSVLSVYDLSVHSGAPSGVNDTSSRLYKLRRWPGFAAYPPSDPRTKGEREWIVGLNKARDEWLRTHPRPDLPATAYRTAALLDLCARGCDGERDLWQLRTPFALHLRRPSGRVETHTIGEGPRVG